MKTELHVPSDLKFLGIVENWLLESLKAELGSQVDWSRIESRLRLVLVEAYSNVVRHAHRDQPNLPVLIRLELKERNLSLEIWDSGSGFELEQYLAPEPQDYQEGGYGWLILHRLMDTVEYRLKVGEGQNCLAMKTSLATHEAAQPKPKAATETDISNSAKTAGDSAQDRSMPTDTYQHQGFAANSKLESRG